MSKTTVDENMNSKNEKIAHKRPSVVEALKQAGPGIITGAADDDPSGIATYILAGSKYGNQFLWASVFTWPLMAVVQMACARVAFTTNGGLAQALRERLPRWVLIPLCLALLAANSLNIGADLAAMAEGIQLLIPMNYHVLVFLLAGLITAATIFLRYEQISKVLKWLSFSLISYVIVAFILKPDWFSILKDVFKPSLPNEVGEWKFLVAILGTTISPYLFFWQASQEVEEGACEDTSKDKNALNDAIYKRGIDITLGTLFSNAVMFFVILSASLTLNKNGLTDVETSKQAAQALVPIAGKFASLIFTLGIVGVGLLAIPTLSGSAAYAISETLNWKSGLNLKWAQGRMFYAVIVISTLFAVMIDLSSITPMKALYASAVINGLLAPVILAFLFWLFTRSALSKTIGAPLWMKAILGLTAVVMIVAGIAMFV